MIMEAFSIYKNRLMGNYGEKKSPLGNIARIKSLSTQKKFSSKLAI
ncbi:MAG: hypothetical protein GX267_10410 [Fibrobacter sp.]|jgi:hypothetical protein|nr:hypothetical protein [Fibrobacter sp.]